jgi:hypothetical protein
MARRKTSTEAIIFDEHELIEVVKSICDFLDVDNLYARDAVHYILRAKGQVVDTVDIVELPNES